MESFSSEKTKCFGPGNVLKRPLGLGRGTDVTVYNDSTGKPSGVACPFAINTSWGEVFCAANYPKAIQEEIQGKSGSLAKVGTCFRAHPRGK